MLLQSKKKVKMILPQFKKKEKKSLKKEIALKFILVEMLVFLVDHQQPVGPQDLHTGGFAKGFVWQWEELVLAINYTRHGLVIILLVVAAL